MIQLFILSLWRNSNKSKQMSNSNYLQLGKMSWFKLICMAFVSVLTVSCLEKDVYQGPDGDGETDGSANLFDFSTKKNVTINLDYQKDYKIPFKVFYSNPLKADGTLDDSKVPFIDGKTPSDGKISIKYDALPAGTSEIYVYSPTLTVQQLMTAKVEGDVLNFVSENSDKEYNSLTRAASDKGSYYKGWNPLKCTYNKSLGDWNADGYPNYINQADDKYKLKVTDKFERTIDGTLNNENINYGLYLTHEYVKVSEDANVFINFVDHRDDNEHNNALAYYVLAPGEEEPTTAPTNLMVAFPNLRAKDLKQGDVIKLNNKDGSDKFPKGSKIGFVLLKDAFHNGKIDENVNLVYSCKRFNAYTILKDNEAGSGSIAADRPHMFAFMADGNLVFSFEDMPWHERRTSGQVAHGDFSDDIFTITANPIEALPDDIEPGVDPDEEIEEEGTIKINSAGILSFEDNWPRAGDYDLNDVVFGYQRTCNYDFINNDVTLLSIDEVYTFMNDGATFKNGFGYEMGGDIKREDVVVTVTSDKKCAGQGLDPDLDKATVMLVDNTNGLTEGTVFKVHTKIKNRKYSSVHMAMMPYNPFIVSLGYGNGNYLDANRIEVHLPKTFAPTPKADASKFGTESDKSLVDGSKFYYIRSGNYPFALEIVGAFGTTEIPNFRIPEENKPIDATYPKFNDWVKNPSANADWWK